MQFDWYVDETSMRWRGFLARFGRLALPGDGDRLTVRHITQYVPHSQSKHVSSVPVFLWEFTDSTFSKDLSRFTLLRREELQGLSFVAYSGFDSIKKLAIQECGAAGMLQGTEDLLAYFPMVKRLWAQQVAENSADIVSEIWAAIPWAKVTSHSD